MHLDKYCELTEACGKEKRDLFEIRRLASELDNMLTDAMCGYGWEKPCLTGDSITDDILKKLDKHLGGARATRWVK